jgi:hypothetical protein
MRLATLALASFTAVLLSDSVLAERNRVLCGAEIRSVVKTEDAATTTSSTTFVRLPGAAAQFSVPSGETRCVKVTFNAQAACRATSGSEVPEVCQVRVLDNDVEMLPQGARTIKTSPAQAAHAFEWVSRVGAGRHMIRLQRRATDEATEFRINGWTLDVQIHE